MKTLVQGSYGRNDFQRGVSGLGDDQALSFADQTLLGIVQAQPTVTYTEWAVQDGDVTWKNSIPRSNYQAFALTDQQLVAASLTATAVPTDLAVIATKLTYATQVRAAFDKTPYEYVSTEGVYAQSDAGNPPAPYFLYWIRLRAQTDPNAGNVSLNYAAAQVQGVLSYILATPLSGADRARPSQSFAQALQQGGSQSSLVPQTDAEKTTTPVQPPAPASAASTASASSSNGKALLIVGLGAAAVFGGYHLIAGGGRSGR